MPSRLKSLFAAVVLLSLPVSFVQAKTPNDPLFPDQWYLSKIAAPAAWDTETGSQEVIVAVLDTGVDLDHPELSNNLWTNSKEVSGNHEDDDGNGFIDDVNGWDFVDHDNGPTPVQGTEDVSASSHGTFVAGLIGAQANNGLGYAGVMWSVKIMPLRVLDADGSGSEDATAAAIDYAVANGARVINMSFAGDQAGSRLKTAVRKAYEAGVVVVAALGNNGQNVNVSPVYPACLHSDLADWVLGVAATGEQDNETEFTNFGSDCADLSAPGQNMLGLNFQNASSDSLFSGPWDGTSAASPLVSGAAGLLLSKYPSLTPEQVFSIIKLSVDPITNTISGAGQIGVGRLNVARALELAPSFVANPGTGTKAPEPTSGPSPVPTADQTFNDNSHLSFIALGAGVGQAPNVTVDRADGTNYASFPAYAPNFQGGIHVALADLDQDGIPEVATGAGVSGGPHVRVFKAYGALINEFFAYAKDSDQGVNIALGDVDADGVTDVVTSVGAGVSNDVVVWSLAGVEKSRFTVTGFAPNVPLAVAVADVDDDWDQEIVVYATSGDSKVAVYNADGTKLVDFVPVPGDTGGLSLGVGDLDGDFRDEIVTVAGSGATASVRIYNKIGAYWGGFTVPEPANTRLGVSVANIDAAADPEIVLAPLNTAGDVKVYAATGDLLSTITTVAAPSTGNYLAAW